MIPSIPATYLSPSWHGAFPAEDAKIAVRFLQVTWDELLAICPQGISYKKKKEDKITAFFGQIMRDRVEAAGLGGSFDYEIAYGCPNLSTGELENSIRTDIRYTFPKEKDGTRRELIFEFKKLNNLKRSRDAYCYASGMGRFISGNYRAYWDIACMVGLLTDDATAAVTELKKTIQTLALSDNPLHIQHATTNEIIREPSEYMAGIANFDTIHSRNLYGDLPDLLLCHFFLNPPVGEAEVIDAV